jgi:hypothetical protein
MNALHQIDVAAVESGLCGDRKKAQHARIDRLVDWMANAGNDALFGTIAVDDLCGDLDEVRARVISAIGKCLLEHDRRMFHATDEHAAQAAQAGRNCGLQRLRCAGDSQQIPRPAPWAARATSPPQTRNSCKRWRVLAAVAAAQLKA